MYEILTSLVRLVAPVICFTAEEVWQALPNREEREWSVHMADMPAENDRYLDKALEEKWKKRLALRSVVTKALEEARRAKVIGHPLDAEITIYADGEHLETLKAMEKNWRISASFPRRRFPAICLPLLRMPSLLKTER